MLKNQETKNKIGKSNSKMQGMKFPQKKIKSKDLGNISLDLSKEEKIMRNTPGLMENSMIENITTMNSIFAQKQSERLMLNNNFNQLNNLNNINDSHSNSINNSNQTFNALVSKDISGPNMNGENPLDMAVIIKDSSEIKEEEEKKKQQKRKKSKKKSKKKKKKRCNKIAFLIIFLLIVIVLLIIGLIMTYISISKER